MNATLSLATEAMRDLAWVRLAVAFGSVSRGTAHAGSDLDVGVILADDAPRGGLTTLELALGRAIGTTVDLVDLSAAPPLLRFEVARDGCVLWERDDEVWPSFRARAMLDWFDWAPTARRMAAVRLERLRDQVARGTG